MGFFLNTSYPDVDSWVTAGLPRQEQELMQDPQHVIQILEVFNPDVFVSKSDALCVKRREIATTVIERFLA